MLRCSEVGRLVIAVLRGRELSIDARLENHGRKSTLKKPVNFQVGQSDCIAGVALSIILVVVQILLVATTMGEGM